MSDINTTIDTYFDMWNEADPDKRAELIERAWAPAGRYLDPALEAEGHAALSEMVAGVHGHFPGHRFRRTSDLDVHHDRVRFAWELAADDGTVAVAGIDVGQVGDDGRLQTITGFFGELAAAAA